MAAYFKAFPFQVDFAEDGQIALDKMQKNRYDVVYMDMQMPIMDGLTATAKYREWEKTQKREPTKIIALSAGAMSEEMNRSLAVGCDRYLTKPIKKFVLIKDLYDSFKN